MTPVTIAQLRAASTVDLMTAARALGLGRTKAYELARRQQFPCRVLRIGDTYRAPTVGLLELLGLAPDEPDRTLSAGEAEGGELEMLTASMPGPPVVRCRLLSSPGSSHQAVVRDPVAERGSGPGERAEPFRRLDAHRLRRADQIAQRAEVNRICPEKPTGSAELSALPACMLIRRSTCSVTTMRADRRHRRPATQLRCSYPRHPAEYAAYMRLQLGAQMGSVCPLVALNHSVFLCRECPGSLVVTSAEKSPAILGEAEARSAQTAFSRRASACERNADTTGSNRRSRRTSISALVAASVRSSAPMSQAALRCGRR